MQRNHLTSNPILSMAALALAVGAFILTVTGSLREAFDLALSREAATVPSITVRPLSASPASQEAVIRELWRVEGVQGVTATLRGSFKPEEERHSPITHLPDTIQSTRSDLPGLEFPPPDPGAELLTGRLPRPVLEVEGPANINEAVAGYELAQRLGKQVGDTLVVNEHPLVIVGIWQPSTLSPGNVVQVSYDIIRQWLPQSARGPALSAVEGFDEMTVILAPGYDVETVARRIWDQVPQVEVLSPAQEQAERRRTMLALDLVVLYSVLLTVLVGGATTINATLMATPPLATPVNAGGERLTRVGFSLGGLDVNVQAERAKPIRAEIQPPKGAFALSTRRFIIGRPDATKNLPLKEGGRGGLDSISLMLLTALAGGLGGLVTGWLATMGLNAYTVHYQARTLFIVTPRLAGGVVLLSVLVGLAAGVWPALWAQLRPPHASRFKLYVSLLGVALATPGVMLIGSLVESLYCSLDEGQRVAVNRISVVPTASGVAYYEPLAAALRRWPGILGIAVEAYGGAIVEEEERWIDRLPPSGIVYGFRSDREDFGLGVPYRVELWQGRVFQPESLDEAVIGYDLAAQRGLKVGDTLTIRDHDFTVVGIRQRLIYGRMNDFNLRAEVSLEALRRILGQPYAFGTITAFIPPAEREEDQELFLARLVDRFSGTAVVTVKDRLAEVARGFPMVESLIVESSDDTLLRARFLYLGLLAGVAIPLWGLAGLGMVSGLELSLASSRQEIQLRKLFGASHGDVLARWLERAALWAGMGGLIGMGAGWLLIEAINLYTNSYQLSAISYQQVLTLILTPRLVVTTFVITVLLGVIAGLGPAWQAARLSPVEGSFWE